MWADKAHIFLQSPVTWGIITLILAAIALSGRVSMNASNILLLFAFLIGCLGVFSLGQGIHLRIIFCLLLGIGLTLISWWIQPSLIQQKQSTVAEVVGEQPKQPTAKEIPTDVVTKLDLENMEKRLLEQLQTQAAKKMDMLEKKYPKGYFLFASNKNIIIPQDKEVRSNFNLDWDLCEIAYMDDNFIDIALKRFHYFPKDILFTNLDVVLERRIGSIASGIQFNNIGLFVELLNDEGGDNITYVIGFKSVKTSMVGGKWDIDPKVEKFLKTLNKPIMPGIDTNIREHIVINDMIMSVGWKLLRK